MKRLINLLVATRLAQWVMLVLLQKWNPHGWVFVRKGDPRFVAPDPRFQVPYAGNPQETPTALIAVNRASQNATWLVVERQGGVNQACLLAIETFDGRWLVCLSEPFGLGAQVALRVRREPGAAFFVGFNEFGAISQRQVPKTVLLDCLSEARLREQYLGIRRV